MATAAPDEESRGLISGQRVAGVDIESSDNDAPLGLQPSRGSASLSVVAKLLLGVAGVSLLVGVVIAELLRTSTEDESTVLPTHQSQHDDFFTARVRGWTANYVKNRVANSFKDLREVEHLFSSNAEMHIDLSRAKFLVAQDIRMKCGTDLTGPKEIHKYYRAYPSEPQDVAPEPETFDCRGNMCTVTEIVRRFPVGEIHTQAIFRWNTHGKLDKLLLMLS